MPKRVSFYNVVPKAQTQDSIKNVRVETLRNAGCPLCPLDRLEKSLLHPKMGPDGPDNAPYYILGEAPGADEDKKGRPFVGRSGRLLRENIPGDLQVRIWNTIRCRPSGNKTPEATEVECCRNFIVEDIEKVAPKWILLAGGQAFKWVTGIGSYQRYLGTWFPARIGRHTAWAMVVPHPAYVLRQEAGSYEALMFEKGVEDFFDGPPDIGPRALSLEDIDQTIEIAEDEGAIVRFFDGRAAVAFDLETTSLERGDRVFRPYGRGCEILCAAFAGKDRTLVVPQELVPVAVEHMTQTHCVAHNLAFDLEWLEHFYPGTLARGGWGCTKAQAYVLHERPSSRLNDLSAVLLGLYDLKKQSGIDVTRLKTANKDLMWRYCGRDAAATFHLWETQSRQLIGQGLWETYEAQRDRILPAIMAQNRGVFIDVDPAEDLAAELEGYLGDIEQEIEGVEEINKYGKPVDLTSAKDIAGFLEHLGFGDRLRTEERKGGVTTDDATLAAIDHPIVEIIRDHRRISKLLTTYIAPLVPSRSDILWPDGRAHSSYNMSKLVTRRSSCEGPNLQNQPKRNPKHAKLVRDFFVPEEGRIFLSMDYGQIEARVVAMGSQDAFLVDAIRNNYDIHAEWAEKILRRVARYHPAGHAAFDDPKLFKEVRQRAKGWVFGNLFGSSLRGAVQHVGAPERVVKDLYEEFWDQMPGVRRWHKRLVKDYQKNGYVELLTGFRRHGPLSYHEAVNTPVQGTSFDIVCDAWFRFMVEAQESGDAWMFPAIQIHDDLTFEVPADDIDNTIDRIVRTAFDWDENKLDFINVPLTIEISTGEAWGSMTEIGHFSSGDYR